MIYFLQVGDNGPVKIGYSHNPLTRLRAAQTYHWHTVVMVGTRPGSKDDERTLHVRLAPSHIRGEWFRADDCVKREIASCPTPMVVVAERPPSTLAHRRRVKTAADTRDALAHLAQQGVQLGGAPYGQAHGERDASGRCAIEQVQSELPVIDQIVRLYRAGNSYAKIAAELNGRGIKARKGGDWRQSSVGAIVRRAREQGAVAA